MYPRVNYEMTQEDLDVILDACKAVPMIMLQCGNPSSPQENANRAWEALGKKMGFDHTTVEPAGGGMRFFSAVPSETLEQKIAHEKKEADETRFKDIARLLSEIEVRKEALKALEAA